MATYTPPTELLPIFDSSVYTADTTPLTVGEANKKYVKYPTAQGLTTFPSGINTNKIDTTDSTGSTNISLYSSATNCILDIGPIFGIPGQSTLMRLGPGGNVNLQLGANSAGSKTFVQYIDAIIIGSAVSLYTTLTSTLNFGLLSTAINIGTTAPSSSAITLGSSTSRINALGSVSMNLINPSTASTIMNIGTTNTGEMNIGTNTDRTGILHLGDGDSASGGIHINNGTASSGNTQIMNGSSASGTLNLGSVANSVVINVNRPLTLNYNPSVLSTGTQIGYTYTPTVTWTTSSSSAICSQSLTQGIYQLNFSISTTGTFVDNFIYLYNETTPSPIPSLSYRIPFIRSGASYNLCSGSSIVKMTTTKTLYLVNYSANTQTGSNGEVYITRIG